MTEEEKGKQSAQNDWVFEMRALRRSLKVALAKRDSIQLTIDLLVEDIQGMKRQALREGLDPLQEYTSYE